MKKSKLLKFQASSISRISKCPGSATLDAKLPDRLRYFAYQEAADFGTLCHAAGEMLIKKAPAKAQAELRKKITEHPRCEDIEYISAYYGTAVLAQKIPKSILYVEEKFRATISGVDCVAKSDAFYVRKTPGKEYVRKIDLKSGNYDYTESAQAQMNFAAELYMYKNKFPDGSVYDNITIQPAYYNDARRIIKSQPKKFIRWVFEKKIRELAYRQKELNAGDHCKMCGAILTCPVVKNLIEEFFEMSKKATKEDLNFVEIYEKKNAVITFLEALDNFLKSELEAGKIFPGVGLVEYSGHRRWIDTGEVEEKLAYLKDKIFKARELKTPAQMEKIAGKENIAGLYDSPRLKKVALKENNFSPVFDE